MSIILPLIKVCCIFSSAHLFSWQRYDSNTWVIKALLFNLYFLNIGVFHQCLLYFIDVQIYLGPSLTSFLLSSINNLPYLQISNLLCLDFLIFKYFKNKLSFSAWGIFLLLLYIHKYCVYYSLIELFFFFWERVWLNLNTLVKSFIVPNCVIIIDNTITKIINNVIHLVIFSLY